MKNTDTLVSTAASAVSPLGPGLPASPIPFAVAAGHGVTAWPDYLVDAFQRSVLFLGLLRQRGDEEVEITSRPMATVLSFGHEALLDARSLPRPINDTLSRIIPSPGATTDPRTRPVVVVDPWAGQGPGVGGFQVQSGIGAMPSMRVPSRAAQIACFDTWVQLMIAQHTLALVRPLLT